MDLLLLYLSLVDHGAIQFHEQSWKIIIVGSLIELLAHLLPRDGMTESRPVNLHEVGFKLLLSQ
jgi:hypothetical protein